MPETVLELQDLEVSFDTSQGEVQAIRGVNLCVKKGEIVCIVGESGCGKTVMCQSVMRLLPKQARIKNGSIRLCGKEITDCSDKELRMMRRTAMSMVFQDPLTTLNPTIPVGKQIMEILLKSRRISRKDAREKVLDILREVGIEDAERRFHLQPHFLSGGMRQRCVLAAALISEPQLLFADEATTALDVTVETKILDLLLEIREKRGLSLVFVTHDLGAAARIADRVAVMQAGEIVETGTAKEVFYAPHHPYTRKLLSSHPMFRPSGIHGTAAGPPDGRVSKSRKILEVQHLRQYFVVRDRLTVRAVEDLSLAIQEGETFGLVGESGCGKSTVARSLVALYRPTGGAVLYEGTAVAGEGARKEQQKKMRQEMQMIFQDSAAALNPRMTMEQIISEPLRIQRPGMEKGCRRDRLEEVLRQVGLPLSVVSRYPGELSGGQRQRAAIARSLISDPRLIIADEPVASLDISTQAQIITLLEQLIQERRFTLFFIAHELSLVRRICDRTGVMLKGRLVELAPTGELFGNPRHPYTKSLLSAIHLPDPVRERSRKLVDYDRGEPLGERMVERETGHFVLE